MQSRFGFKDLFLLTLELLHRSVLDRKRTVLIQVLLLRLFNLIDINSWITDLHDLVEVGQSLVLIHLSHAQFFDQKFFNLLELIDFLVDFVNFGVSLLN